MEEIPCLLYYKKLSNDLFKINNSFFITEVRSVAYVKICFQMVIFKQSKVFFGGFVGMLIFLK